MSKVIVDFIEPYREVADTDEGVERLVAVGVEAWNISMLPEKERNAAIARLVRMALCGGSAIKRLRLMIRTAILGESRDFAEFKGFVNELVERKLRHYAENRRLIMGYELTQTADDFHLSVVSTLTSVV